MYLSYWSCPFCGGLVTSVILYVVFPDHLFTVFYQGRWYCTILACLHVKDVSTQVVRSSGYGRLTSGRTQLFRPRAQQRLHAGTTRMVGGKHELVASVFCGII